MVGDETGNAAGSNGFTIARGRVIQPSEIRRVNFVEMICPECGARFDAAKTKRGKQ